MRPSSVELPTHHAGRTTMTSPKPDPFLITGIPGTGKTTFGDTGAKDFGFHHHNLEDIATLTRWAANPTEFVQGIVRQKRNSVVTWDFVPDHVPSVQSVLDFKKSGFKLVWFDGNRPAALQAFRRRGTV